MAGVSGDMIVGALLDLGADVTKVVEAMKSVKDYMKGCRNLEVTIKDVTRRGIHAKKVDVKAEEAPEMTGSGLIEATVNCTENLKLSEEAQRFASDSINTLVNAEGKVHGKSINEVHLHEAGFIDTPAEIVGAAVALENLNIFNTKVYSTPIAVGEVYSSFHTVRFQVQLQQQSRYYGLKGSQCSAGPSNLNWRHQPVSPSLSIWSMKLSVSIR
jgi:hypothetical protein